MSTAQFKCYKLLVTLLYIYVFFSLFECNRITQPDLFAQPESSSDS